MTDSEKPWYVKLTGAVICLILLYLFINMVKKEVDKTEEALNLYSDAYFQCIEVKDHFYYDSLYGIMRVRKVCTTFKLVKEDNIDIPVYPMFRNNVLNRALGIKFHNDNFGE